MPISVRRSRRPRQQAERAQPTSCACLATSCAYAEPEDQVWSSQSTTSNLSCGRSEILLAALSRPVIGAIGGMTVFLAVRAGATQTSEEQVAYVMLVSFGARFFERLVVRDPREELALQSAAPSAAASAVLPTHDDEDGSDDGDDGESSDAVDERRRASPQAADRRRPTKPVETQIDRHGMRRSPTIGGSLTRADTERLSKPAKR